MAKRLEVAFGLSAKRLLEMQAELDAAKVATAQSPVTVKRHVVPLRQHTAVEIENWAPRNLRVRSRFPVLLRTLVNSTGAVTRSDFPGNDDAERAGWDGWTECSTPTPWIPAGKTGWELGTTSKVRGKADDDYDKSVRAHTPAELTDITFIFVTPRSWPQKTEWAKARKAEGKWKDVRAYDSSDLEQWVEQSVPAQVWLSSELNKAADGAISLDDAWREWADAAEPALPASLFNSVLPKGQKLLAAWLNSAPDKPFVLASDSTEEALGFLATALQGPDGALASARDRTVIFKQAGVFPRVADSLKGSIVIATSREVERELGAFVKALHVFVIQPRNAANSDANLTLEALTGEAFRQAFEGTSFAADHVSLLARKSGRSLTVLRRQLATVPGIRTPAWALDQQRMVALAPLVLAGTWNASNKTDIGELRILSGEADYELLEQRVAEAAALQDPPFWMVSYRGVTSKIDFLFAAPSAFTRQLLSRFIATAKRVLSEDDPKLDLPDDERWAAAIHNKSRAYSHALRDSIAETLVLLALHGEHLFQATTGFEAKAEVDNLIRELLTPLDARRLEANARDLMAYAESSPEVFLELLERDLKTPQPASFALLRPAGTMFGGCPRSELLWALEGLAWSEQTLHRSVLILAKLSTVEIKDNWSNKPISTLTSIFRPWMPQTAADHDARIKVLQLVIRKQPDVAWRLLMSLLPRGPQVGHYNHKPRWRNEGYGLGEPIPKTGPVMRFMAAVAELALDWPEGYDASRLCDLIEVGVVLSTAYVEQIWAHVERWAPKASDADRAMVREKIRVSLLGRRAKLHGEKRADWAKRLQGATRAYELLLPTNLVAKHAWLFKDIWLHDAPGELEDTDYRTRDARVQQLRTQALTEIYEALGLDGLLSVARGGKAARVVGAVAAADVLDAGKLLELVRTAISAPPLDAAERELAGGAITTLEGQRRRALLDGLRSEVAESTFCEALKLAPFNRETWELVDGLSEDERLRYWREINPWYVEDAAVMDAVERLVAAGRPRAAFAVAQHHLKELKPGVVYALLSRIARASEPEPGNYQIEQHWLIDAFERLNAASELTVEEKAFLEFAYIDALWVMRQGGGDTHLVPNLERYLEEHPEFYVQALVWAFKRSDEGEDPPEMKAPPNASHLALRAYKLLESMGRLPASKGAPTPSYDNLSVWISEVRNRARELARLEVADMSLGKLLAASAPDEDGVWPGELARRAIEDIGTDEVAEGVRVAAFNSRGVIWRGRGGDQERELATKYRDWAQALLYTHPFVSAAVLQRLAENYEDMAKREDEREVLRERVRD